MSFLKYQKKNPEFLNSYLKYKRFIECESQTTVDEAFYDLRTLFRYIKLFIYEKEKLSTITKEEFKKIEIIDIKIKDLGSMTEQDLQQYIFFLKYTLNNDVKTRNKKLASMKRFYEYLAVNNLISINPTKNIKAATLEKRLPKHLDINESKQLLSNAINSESRYKIRNYAILCIFLNCSLRLSELVNINLTDIKIDSTEQTLRVNGKGNKQRILYLDAAVCEAITAYLKIRPKLLKDNPDYNALFLSSRNKRISRRSIQTIVKEQLTELFGDSEENIKKTHTHILRHTSTTLLYNENDVDIFILKKILGHNCLAATELYTHISQKKLKELMLNFDVLDRKD